MGRKEAFKLRAAKHQSLPEEEWFRLSTNDFLAPAMFLQYCLYFDLGDSDRNSLVQSLKAGLEETIGQCRSLRGTIVPNEYGDYSIRARRDDTVTFVVQWLDEAGDENTMPSFAELEKANFVSSKLAGAPNITLDEMAWRPGALSPSPHDSPPLVGFQLNFIPGGAALVGHFHHWALDWTGFASFMQQWAENTRALSLGQALPTIDSNCMDRSPLGLHWDIKDEDKADAPAPPPPHPGHQEACLTLLQITRAKANKLKSLATTEGGPRLSSYDAFAGLIWRIVSRHRLQTHKADPNEPIYFYEAVSIRHKMTPQLPERFLGNAIVLGSSTYLPEEDHLTAMDVAEDAPLARVAGHIRKITESSGLELMQKDLLRVAHLRQKERVFYRLHSFPPMTFKTTDWRTPNVCLADFGFGKAKALRSVWGSKASSNVYLYPPRQRVQDGEEVFEISVPVERVALERFLDDAELKEWFDFGGFEIA